MINQKLLMMMLMRMTDSWDIRMIMKLIMEAKSKNHLILKANHNTHHQSNSNQASNLSQHHHINLIKEDRSHPIPLIIMGDNLSHMY